MNHDKPDNTWTLCWEDTEKVRRLAFFPTPDAVADKLKASVYKGYKQD